MRPSWKKALLIKKACTPKTYTIQATWSTTRHFIEWVTLASSVRFLRQVWHKRLSLNSRSKPLTFRSLLFCEHLDLQNIKIADFVTRVMAIHVAKGGNFQRKFLFSIIGCMLIINANVNYVNFPIIFTLTMIINYIMTKLTKFHWREYTEAAAHRCSLGSILETQIDECRQVTRRM